MPKRSSHLIYTAFLLSGLASLLFQIVMMRQFGLIFGVGLVSSAVVIGIFLLGLGAGSFLGGRLARHYFPAQPQKLVYSYVLVETILALLTTGSVLLFSEFESVSAMFSRYVVGEHGWFYLDSFSVAARIGAAFVAVFPSACLMGFGFPLLTCFEQLKPDRRISDTVSYLYAFNTFGAALACLFADTLFIPSMGLVGVQAFVVGCYAIGALAVFVGYRHVQPSSETHLTNEPPVANAAAVSGFGLLMMVFLSGFFSIALEMIWLRFTSGFVGQRRISSSMVLFVFLFFVQVGSFASPRVVRRFKNTAGLFVVLQGFALWTAVLCLCGYSEEFGVPTETYFEGQSALLAALKLVALPAFFFGVSFPVLNLLLHAGRGSIAASTGLVFLLNSIGAFAASLLTAYFLIPFLGIQNSLTLLLGMLIIAGFIFSKNERSVWVVAVVAALCMLPLQLISPEDFLRLPGRFKAVEAIVPSPQLVQLIEGQQYTVAAVYSGEDNKRRILLSNGFVMSGNARLVRRNMRSAVHLPMLMQTKPESALTICYGIGNAASSILLHPSITRLDIVDVSKDILALSSHFENDNKGVLKDPRTQVFVNDGRQHLRMQSEEKYDFITMDPPPLYFAGIDSLYDLEFNRLVYRSLKPGGIMSLWLPMWHLDKELNRAVIRTFTVVFDDVMMIETGVGNYVLIGRKNEQLRLSKAEYKSRLQTRPAVDDDLKNLNLGSVPQFFGQFTSGNQVLQAAVADAAFVTDLKPSMEYVQHELLESELPVEVYGESGLSDWCVDCASAPLIDKNKKLKSAKNKKNNKYEDLENSENRLLENYIQFMAAIRRHPSYVRVSLKARHYDLAGLSSGLSDAEIQELSNLYPELRYLISQAILK